MPGLDITIQPAEADETWVQWMVQVQRVLADLTQRAQARNAAGEREAFDLVADGGPSIELVNAARREAGLDDELDNISWADWFAGLAVDATALAYELEHRTTPPKEEE